MTSTTQRPARQYRYGTNRTWEVVLEAVRAMGRPVTSAEVGGYIVAQHPGFARANIGPDLSVLSVNCNSRGNHAVNRVQRRTDSGNAYDQLFRLGQGRGVRFTEYVPTVHGVWALVDVGDKVLRPKLVCSADSIELDAARETAASKGMFDPDQDARRRNMSAIVQREGQPGFRADLLHAYVGTCAITGCTVASLLEAAHIVPYRGAHTNVVENGLLLRADLHKLFDLHMLRIDPGTRTIHLCEELKKSEYGPLEGRRLRDPAERGMMPMREALEHHEKYCAWAFVKPDGLTSGEADSM